MKKLRCPSVKSRHKKAACTVSAAALMLGVSHAAVVGLHFQSGWDDYNAPGYTGFAVTATAFGIPPSQWENLTPMETGYGGGDPGSFMLTEIIDTTTSTNGLNPLPSGSLSVSWQANAANTSGFGLNDPNSYGPNNRPNQPHRGEQEVYNGFLRDGVFIYTSPSPVLSGYKVTISGLKSVFTNSQYAVRLAASTDSGKLFTNGIISSLTTTTLVSYSAVFTNYYDPNVFAPANNGRIFGVMGGLSTGSAALSDDSITIAGAPAYDGPTPSPGSTDPGPGIASTISGVMIADSPVIVYSPKTPVGLCAGDTAELTVDAFGVPPLSYQWRKDGVAIPGATSASYTVSDVGAGNAGVYDVVVTNFYGEATSAAASVAGPDLLLAKQGNVVLDTKPVGPAQNALNNGASWVASSSDGKKTRTGVMAFSGSNYDQVSLTGATNLQSPTGAITFWMRSAGTLLSAVDSSVGALIFTGGDSYDSDFNGISIIQDDTGVIAAGNLGLVGHTTRYDSGVSAMVEGGVEISDDSWHLIVVDFDQTVNGGLGLYVDGVLDTTNSNLPGVTNSAGASWSWPVGSAQQMALGLSHKTNWRPYDGQLDDVRIYSRILEPAEIAQIYSSDALVDTNALKLRYNFDTAPTSGYALSWTCGTTLQTSTNVAGPYVDVTVASSPWVITPSQAQRFFQTK